VGESLISAPDLPSADESSSTHKALLLLGAIVLAVMAGAAFLPVRFASREELFEIPKGTWARRRAGEKLEILPQEIRLVQGAHDVLVLRNLDDVPQIFGPTLLMPGQRFRLPFDQPSEYQFACTAHASGQMTIVVEPEPRSAWDRLRWRARNAARTLSRLYGKESAS
jgi:hypothetical protein